MLLSALGRALPASCTGFHRRSQLWRYGDDDRRPAVVLTFEFATTCCAGSFALAERARYFNPRCLSGAEKVLVKTFLPGLVQPEDLQPLIGEVATLGMLRHR